MAPVQTDLVILAESSNTPKSTSASVLSQTTDAAAVGYVYYDDGVTLDVKPSRFDVYFILGDDGKSATLQVKQVLSDFEAQGNAKEEVGSLIIMMASDSGLDGATTATVTLNDGSTVDVDNLSYDSDGDLLIVDLSAEGASMWDIDNVLIA